MVENVHPTPKTSFKVKKWSSFILCAICYAFVHFHRYIPSVLADEIAPELHVEVSELGIFSSMYYWSYAVLQPFAGCFCDVIDSGYIIGVSGICSSVGSLIIGLSHNFGLSSFGRFLVGVGCAWPYVSTSRFMANWFEPKEYTIASSILLCIGGIGGVLSQLPLIYLARAIGWRWALIGVAIVGFVFSSLGFFFIRSSPVKLGYPLIEGTAEPPKWVSFKFMIIEMWHHLLQVITKVAFWIHSISILFSCSCFQNLSSMWAVPFLTDVYGYTKDTASSITISLLVVMIVGSPMLGWISYKTGMTKWLNFICQICGLVFALIFVIWTDKLPLPVIIILFFIYGISTTSTQSFTFPMLKDMASPECAGTIVGCGNMWIFLGTAIFQSISSGIMNSMGSSPYSAKAYKISLWTVSAVQLLIAAIAAAFTPKDYAYHPPEASEEEEEDVYEKGERPDDLPEL